MYDINVPVPHHLGNICIQDTFALARTRPLG